MAELSDVFGSLIPSGGTQDIARSSFSFFVNFMILILVIIAAGIAVWFAIQRKRFNKKIVIWEKVGNTFEPTIKDKAMEMKHGSVGDTIFFIKRMKKYVPTPSLQTGRNTFYFFKRQDGELINFTPADFDLKSKELGAQFLDKEMKYARTSLDGSWKERYEKQNFWDKYGQQIVNFGSIVIIMLFLWLIVKELMDISGAIQGAINAAKEVQESTKEILIGLDNIKNG